MAEAVRDADALMDLLGLPDELRDAARQAAEAFPVFAPRSYVARMRPGDPTDPLLRQVLPLGEELRDVPGFVADPVGDTNARPVPGLLRKYRGRALLIATGTCAVHCRYCFRRHYPYGEEPRALDAWQPAFEAIAADASLREAILSGGDPLTLTDVRFGDLVARVSAIEHVTRLRIHTRLPIVLPDRVTDDLLAILHDARPRVILVVHANHANELVGDCADALERLRGSGFTLLNQAVLLRGVNDSVAALEALCERAADLGVMPYYLHQLDRVAGAAHFEVPEAEGRQLVEQLRSRLPGYAVPRYVREVAGEAFKAPIGD